MVITVHGNGVTKIQCKRGDKVTKSKMIIAHNKYVGGVDKCDQHLWIIISLAGNLYDGGSMPSFA